MTADQWYLQKNGNAQLLEFGYNGRGLGVTVTGRRLEWMNSQIISRKCLNFQSYELCAGYVYSVYIYAYYLPSVCSTDRPCSAEFHQQR